MVISPPPQRDKLLGIWFTHVRTELGRAISDITDNADSISTINETGLFQGEATLGADWDTNLTNRPTELTDGRVSAGLDSSGDLDRNILSSRADSSDILRRTSGGLFIGELAATQNTGALADQDDVDFATEVTGAEKPQDNATLNTGALADLDTVSSSEIDALAITETKLAAAAVTNAKLAAAAVDTAEVADNAISITAFGVDTTLTPTSATYVTILTLSLTSGTSDVVEVVISTRNAFLTFADANVIFRVLRNEGSDVTVFERDWTIVGDNGSGANTKAYVFMDDAPTGGGTITYKLQYKLVGTSDSGNDRVREIYFRARQMKK